MDKRALRRACRELAAPQGAEGERRARACQLTLLGLPELAACRSVSLYSADRHEVPLDAVARELWARGVSVVLPRMGEAGIELCRVAELGALERSSYGLLEPPASAQRVAPQQVDLFVVPGVAFDRSGSRLGRGKGYYDQLLARARPDACRVGLCYGERLLDELPSDEWDIPMHAIVTDGEVIRVRAARAAS